MSRRQRIIDEVLIGPDTEGEGDEYLVTKLVYHVHQPRGYYVSAHTESRMPTARKIPFLGQRDKLVQPANRFNDPVLAKLRPDADSVRAVQLEVLRLTHENLSRRLPMARDERRAVLAAHLDRIDVLIAQRSSPQPA